MRPTVPPPANRLVPADDLLLFREIGDRLVSVPHRFHHARALQPQALSQLFNCHPDRSLDLCSLEGGTTPLQRIMRPAAIHPWLQAVQQGHLRIRLRNLLEFHPDLSGAVHGIFDEVEVRVRGFTARRRRAELLVLPPRDTFDVPAGAEIATFWQIVGQGDVVVSRTSYCLGAGRMASCPAGQPVTLQCQDSWSLLLVTYHTRERVRRRPWSGRLHAICP